jgi:hypothetical protein
MRPSQPLKNIEQLPGRPRQCRILAADEVLAVEVERVARKIVQKPK